MNSHEMLSLHYTTDEQLAIFFFMKKKIIYENFNERIPSSLITYTKNVVWDIKCGSIFSLVRRVPHVRIFI